MVCVQTGAVEWQGRRSEAVLVVYGKHSHQVTGLTASWCLSLLWETFPPSHRSDSVLMSIIVMGNIPTKSQVWQRHDVCHCYGKHSHQVTGLTASWCLSLLWETFPPSHRSDSVMMSIIVVGNIPTKSQVWQRHDVCHCYGKHSHQVTGLTASWCLSLLWETFPPSHRSDSVMMSVIVVCSLFEMLALSASVAVRSRRVTVSLLWVACNVISAQHVHQRCVASPSVCLTWRICAKVLTWFILLSSYWTLVCIKSVCLSSV